MGALFMMAHNNSTIHKEWLEKAGEDEEAGKKLLAGGGPFGIACFHFQQMAEKLLKGLVIFHGKESPRTHDLVELETILSGLEPDIKNYKKEIDILNSYYVETRYPGDFPEVFADEAALALEAAERLKEFVQKQAGMK